MASKQINDFKNEVICNLIADSKEQEKNIKAEVEVKADSMIKDLGEEAERLNKRLQSMKLVCRFCG